MSTLSVQSITGVSSFDFSNTTFANAYNVANSGFSHSNTTLTHSQTVYAAANSVFGVANAAFGQSNNEVTRLSSSYVVANAAFGKANTALQNTTGNFSGSLGLTGSLGVGTTSISSELTVDGVLPKLEMRSGGYLMMRPVGNNWDMRLQSNGATLSVFSGGDLTNAIATFVHGGSVGIGTASPGGKFHIQDSSNRDGTGHIMAENISTSTAGLTNSQILVKNRYGASQFMQWENNGLRIGSRWTANSGSGNIYFTTGGDATNMTIDSSGRVLKPNQPLVQAAGGGDWVNYTTSGGYFTPSSALTNNGNYYNGGTGTFTCPVSGNYRITFNALVGNGGGYGYVYIHKNGASMSVPALHYNAQSMTIGMTVHHSWILSFSASDTIKFFVTTTTNNFYAGTHSGFTIELIG